MSVAVCKLLTYGGQYRTCHIQVPDIDAKLAAVNVDGDYYSRFRRFDDAETTLQALGKLAQNGDTLALTKRDLAKRDLANQDLTKQNRSQYIMWALEFNAEELRGPKLEGLEWPTYGPANCLILGDARQYHQCYVRVPELAQPMVALGYDGQFYSVYRPGLDAIATLELAAQFAGRGNDSAIATTPNGYALCLWEPEATIHTP